MKPPFSYGFPMACTVLPAPSQDVAAISEAPAMVTETRCHGEIEPVVPTVELFFDVENHRRIMGKWWFNGFPMVFVWFWL